MTGERVAEAVVTNLIRADGAPDRRIRIYLECGYWYDLGIPLKVAVPDLVGSESSYTHTCGVRPAEEPKPVQEKKPRRRYTKMEPKE